MHDGDKLKEAVRSICSSQLHVVWTEKMCIIAVAVLHWVPLMSRIEHKYC